MSPWPWRKRPLRIDVVYRGGAEGWFEFRCRGGSYRSPGGVSIFDVMTVLASVEGTHDPKHLFGD